MDLRVLSAALTDRELNKRAAAVSIAAPEALVAFVM
jgi:hypothetical protein